MNFQGYVTVQLSRFLVCYCSAATSLLYQALFCLSRTFLTFFQKFFWCSFFKLTQRVLILSLIFAIVKNFFIFLNFLFYSSDSKKYGEGGIWTLAPRERSTPLAGAPLQPLEYFSRLFTFSDISITYPWRMIYYT